MAHEFETGMFARGLAAWHKLGTVLPPGHAAETNAIEALRQAGLDWSVEMRPAYIAQGDTMVRLPGVRAIVRATDGKILGNAGDVPRGGANARDGYVPLQNDGMARWFQPVLDAGEARIEAAASLFGGQRVYMLARIGHNGDSHASVVDGDEIVNHWLIANDHSGKHSLRVARCRTRVVCANTLAAAFGEGTYVRIRHGKSMAETLDELRKVMTKERDAFSQDVGIFRELATKSVTRAKLREYVQAVFPESFKEEKKPVAPPLAVTGRGLLDEIMGGSAHAAPIVTDEHRAEGKALVSEILDRVEVLMESGRGANVPGVRGTMWGAYNAVNEYLQYEYGRGPAGATDKRMDAMLFGQPATWNALALQRAIEFGRGQ
jgi:phage/plasmid-like protein (TIGR03299 family)